MTVPSQPVQMVFAALPVMTTATTPAVGKINTYDATAAPLTPTLPSLSSFSGVGANFLLAKWVLDVSTHSITFVCNGSDTFDDGTTQLVLTKPGQSSELQVISRDGGVTKNWYEIQSGGGPAGPTGATGPSGGPPGPTGATGPPGAVTVVGGGSLQVEILANQAAYDAIADPDSNTQYFWYGA